MKFLSTIILIILVSASVQARNSYSCEERGLQIMRISPLNDGDQSLYDDWWVEAIPTRWTLEGLPFERLAIKAGFTPNQVNQFKLVIRYYQYVPKGEEKLITNGFQPPENASRDEIWSTTLSFQEFIGYGTHINSNMIVGNPVALNSVRPGVFSFVVQREGRYYCSTRMNVLQPENHR